MSEESSWKFLRALWGTDELRGLTCCECHSAIDINEAFSRTLKLGHEKASVGTLRPRDREVTEIDLPCAKEIAVPRIQRKIRIFHRHLECLYATTPFITISHVWEPGIAELQYRREESNATVSAVEARVRQLPARIYLALEEGLPGEAIEVWHDYISVPQWSSKEKSEIILKIPELFGKAKMTVVYLADVDASAFDAMRSGASQEVRCRGMGQICSAAWYSRMWTTMEHTESANMLIMARDFKLVAPDDLDRALIDELRGRWRDEVRAHGIGRDLEHIVWADKNLVPWELGTINSVRSDVLAGKRPCFGVVHSVLSRRRVAVEKDFFYAFEGVLKTGFKLGPAIQDYPKEVMLGMAVLRMLSGDLSPLFMIPAHAETGFHMTSGYVDHNTWGLSSEEEPITCTQIERGSSAHSVKFSAEEVGTFRYARRFDWNHRGPEYSLGAVCRMTLEASGLDVDAFVDTIGVRLYGQDRTAIYKRLAQDDRRNQLREQLVQLYNGFVGPDDVPFTNRIADLIGLSNTSLGEAHEEPLQPIVFLQHHGGTIHHDRAGAIVGIMCTTCQQISLLRIALFQPASTLVGTKAYRIPGLKYRFSHAGGVGVLLRERKVVGRFVWGTPTCDCPKLTETEVIVDDLPMPSSNNSRYI